MVVSAVSARRFSVPLRKNSDPFFLIVFLLSTRCSVRIDSAMVEAAVRTVRRRSSGSTASFTSSSMSTSSGNVRLRKKDIRETQSQLGSPQRDLSREREDVGEEVKMPVRAVAVKVDAGAAKAAQPGEDPETPDGRVP